MNHKVKGTIVKIGEKKKLDNGAVVLDYIVKRVSDNGYETLYNMNMYKKEEYVEHIENFTQFNKVGDNVEVEFDIRSREYEGRIYNSLSHWKCSKVEEAVHIGGTVSDLPF